MLTGAFLYLPLVFMPEADSLKHPQQFYLTLLFPQTVFIPSGKSNTTSATAIAIPTVVNASGQVIAKHPPRLSVRSASGSPSPSPVICSPA